MLEECKHRRTQALADIGVAIGLTVLVWPFPLARAALSPAGHVTAILAAYLCVQLVYHAVSAGAWRRTVGMRLTGHVLISEGGVRSTHARSIMWGVASGLLSPWYAVSPAAACRFSVPERLSKLRQAPAEE